MMDLKSTYVLYVNSYITYIGVFISSISDLWRAENSFKIKTEIDSK